MIRFRLEVGLICLAALLATVAWRRWTRASVAMAAPAPVSPPVRNALRTFSAASLDSFADFATSYDPFRLAGAPATVRFEAVPGSRSSAGATPMPATDRYRPLLVVRAISGPPWIALIEGIPGKANLTLVRADGTYDRLRVRSITRDTVVMEGPDTTWTLPIKRGRS
jgi:hypothetical protein